MPAMPALRAADPGCVWRIDANAVGVFFRLCEPAADGVRPRHSARPCGDFSPAVARGRGASRSRGTIFHRSVSSWVQTNRFRTNPLMLGFLSEMSGPAKSGQKRTFVRNVHCNIKDLAIISLHVNYRTFVWTLALATPCVCPGHHSCYALNAWLPVKVPVGRLN